MLPEQWINPSYSKRSEFYSGRVSGTKKTENTGPWTSSTPPPNVIPLGTKLAIKTRFALFSSYNHFKTANSKHGQNQAHTGTSTPPLDRTKPTDPLTAHRAPYPPPS